MSPTATDPALDLILDEAQERVVAHGAGPLLALGGPGS